MAIAHFCVVAETGAIDFQRNSIHFFGSTDVMKIPLCVNPVRYSVPVYGLMPTTLLVVVVLGSTFDGCGTTGIKIHEYNPLG